MAKPIFIAETFKDAVCDVPSAKDTSGNAFGTPFPGAKPSTGSPLGEVQFDAFGDYKTPNFLKIPGSGGEKN